MQVNNNWYMDVHLDETMCVVGGGYISITSNDQNADHQRN